MVKRNRKKRSFVIRPTIDILEGHTLEDLTKKSFLTPSQIQVLQLRSEGYIQNEIAKIMNISRSNISITEKRARHNLEKAMNTIRIFEMIAPIIVKIGKGTDLFDIPKLVFDNADKAGIIVEYNAIQLTDMIREKMWRKLRGREIVEEFTITILRTGRVVVE
ncbi:MAG TPA: Tfx family DNA-binding protein [Euryarchaeota archaeon]|nr:putative transcriptional regulator [archaeon BMS3Bbin15]HDL14735.1 Tfx family DNA-binding protein [Euryarchaeota archaeon]